MEADPHSLVVLDLNKSSVFHYCCEKKNDVLLASLLNLLRRQSLNQSVRIQVDLTYSSLPHSLRTIERH